MQKYTLPVTDARTLANALGLVGLSEIAEKAGVTRGAVTHWRRRHSDFPEPLVELTTGPIWRWADVEPWVTRQKQRGTGYRKPKT
jgi:hypothetical protein